MSPAQAFHVVDGLGHLDTAALATATGMDLGLDHPDGAAQFLCGFHRFLHRERRDAARHGHTELAQDFLALVFVNLHGVSLRDGSSVRRGCCSGWRETCSGNERRNCIMVRCTKMGRGAGWSAMTTSEQDTA